jgi:mono/diheme cytochrome c family protein
MRNTHRGLWGRLSACGPALQPVLAGQKSGRGQDCPPHLGLAYIALLIFAVALSAQTPAGDPQNGKRIFEKYGCYQCHGFDGHGGAGARLAPNPITIVAFSKYVRQPTGEMPPYTAKVVSDRELADIFAFLKSLPPPAPAKNIPLLNR